MFKSILGFFGRWQEPVLWLPLLLLALLFAWYLIPAVDPRAGVDGFGSLWGQLVVAVAVVQAAFFTWLIRRSYFLELTDKDERELLDHACGIERTLDGKRIGHGPESLKATLIWIADRVGHLLLFALLLSHFSP